MLSGSNDTLHQHAQHAHGEGHLHPLTMHKLQDVRPACTTTAVIMVVCPFDLARLPCPGLPCLGRYWHDKGLVTILVGRLLNLTALAFTICFSGFLLLAVNWSALHRCGLDC